MCLQLILLYSFANSNIPLGIFIFLYQMIVSSNYDKSDDFEFDNANFAFLDGVSKEVDACHDHVILFFSG